MKNSVVKKIISFIMIFALLFGVCSISISAADDRPLFTISDVDVRQGEEFDVIIGFARDVKPNVESIAALDLSLLYNSDAFSVVKVTKGDGLNKALSLVEGNGSLGLDKGDYIYACNTNIAGTINWCMSTLSGFTFEKDTEFARITFKARETAGYSGDLSMTLKITNAATSSFVDITGAYTDVSNTVKLDVNFASFCEWEYIESTNSYRLNKFNDKEAKSFTVPDEYNDESGDLGPLPVTAIDSNAFANCKNLESLTFGPNLKSVSSLAFFGSNNLKKIIVYSSETTFNNTAFFMASTSKLVIRCQKNSEADKFATKKRISVEYFDSMTDCTYTGLDEKLYYSGAPVEFSEITVTDSYGVSLVLGEDYTLKYSNNINIGTGKLLIAGIGIYHGIKTVSFKINCPFHNSESGYYTETKHYTDCSEGGKVVKSCSFCGYSDDSQVLPAKEHGDQVWVTTTEPTCCAVGEERLVCSDCGKEFNQREIEKIEHDKQWVTTTPACLTDGEETLICTMCDESFETRVKPCIGDHDKQTITINPTCTKDGSVSEKCSECGTVFSTVTLAKTGHTESGEWVVTKEVSCTENGEKVMYCTTCNEAVHTEVIKAHGHDLEEEYTVLKEATCTEKGKKVRCCKVCHEEVDVVVLAALGHDRSNAQWVVTLEPTCTETGTKSICCNRCNEALQSVIILPLGHTLEDWTVTIEPTCTALGYKQRRCSTCHEAIITQPIAATGHSGVYKILRLPTYSQPGIESYVCEKCGKNLNDNKEIPKIIPDLDGNNKINSADALLVLQYSTKSVTLDEDVLKNADCNGDGHVNSSDALIILQLSIGLISA